jgi:hypothetical protein
MRQALVKIATGMGGMMAPVRRQLFVLARCDSDGTHDPFADHSQRERPSLHFRWGEEEEGSGLTEGRLQDVIAGKVVADDCGLKHWARHATSRSARTDCVSSAVQCLSRQTGQHCRSALSLLGVRSNDESAGLTESAMRAAHGRLYCSQYVRSWSALSAREHLRQAYLDGAMGEAAPVATHRVVDRAAVERGARGPSLWSAVFLREDCLLADLDTACQWSLSAPSLGVWASLAFTFTPCHESLEPTLDPLM